MARELFVLSMVNREMSRIMWKHYATLFFYERIEHCLRRFATLVESRPANTMAWYFHFSNQEKNHSLTIQKQTPKNKCKHKSMMVFVQLMRQHSIEEDIEVIYTIDTHIQCIDEFLDRFKQDFWPHIIDVKFAFGCAYKRASVRREFEQLTKEMALLISCVIQSEPSIRNIG